MGPSQMAQMAHPMDLSRMSRSEIIKLFRKLEFVKFSLERWIENGDGVRFGKLCPVCMRIECLKVIKSCACADAETQTCWCSTCSAEIDHQEPAPWAEDWGDSGDSDRSRRGNVDDVEWWRREDPDSDWNLSDIDCVSDVMRMKKKRMNKKQPKKTSNPKKAKRPLKKQSKMSKPEGCVKIKNKSTHMWNQAVRRAYIALGLSGFVRLGGPTQVEACFLVTAKTIYNEWKAEEKRLFDEVEEALRQSEETDSSTLTSADRKAITANLCVLY